MTLTFTSSALFDHPVGIFIVNFEYYFTPCSSVSIVNYEHLNADLVVDIQYQVMSQLPTMWKSFNLINFTKNYATRHEKIVIFRN